MECVFVAGEELDISHPMLTELDTSEIIRSYIGVELAAADGNVSTSDDAASGLTSNRDFNSELDVSSSSDGDDISLHIRDEACQTGDDDLAAEPRLIGYYPIFRDRAEKLGVGGVTVSGDEEMSVWRTLLHSDDGYNDAENDIVKYKAAPSGGRSFEVQDKSFHDDAVVSIVIPGEDDLPAGDIVGEVCDEHWRGGMSCESPRRLVRSDSSLLASVASSATLQESTTTSQESCSSSSVPCVFASPKPALSEVVEGSCSSRMGMCRNPQPGEDVAVAGAAVSNVGTTDDPASMLISRHLKSCGGSVAGEETAGAATTPESTITSAIQSELPGDAISMTTSVVTRLPIPAAETEKPQSESVNLHATAGGAHPPGVMCMDHQVCRLLADFVAHL